jgi:hypothetical protein
MSLKVMHWAWSLTLAPVQKIVLLALADEANDDGFCFPSVRYLANKCSVDERTIQRVLRKLTRGQYVSIEHRFRRDRARTSNGYRLAINDAPANCHRVPGAGDTDPAATPPGGGRQLCHRGGDSRAGVTTTYPCINPVQQLRTDATGSDAVEPRQPRSGGRDLYFPKGTSAIQRQALAKQLAGVTEIDAQQILDELAGRMQSTHVRDPVRYCARLVQRFKRGEFQLHLGRTVAGRRQDDRKYQVTATTAVAGNEKGLVPAIDGLPVPIRDALVRIQRASSSDHKHDNSDAQ